MRVGVELVDPPRLPPKVLRLVVFGWVTVVRVLLSRLPKLARPGTVVVVRLGMVVRPGRVVEVRGWLWLGVRLPKVPVPRF